MRACRRRRERGQVLLFGVLLVIILLVAAIFLFDLQSVIRLRGRTQHGADSAALAAAGWQGRSLNVVGELNLLKAATLLIADVPPLGDGSAAGLLDSVQLLTEMQTRVSYVGPMLAYETAQQAAKNNGMRPVSIFGDFLNNHISTYLSGAPGSSVYAQTYPNPYQQYDWIPSYGAMLSQAVNNGVAAQPLNSRYLMGIPNLIGSGASLLMDPSFYDAVHSQHYCWFYRRGVGPGATYNFGSIQFQTETSDFFVGSEFFPLYVAFQTSAPSTTLNAEVANRGLTPHDLEQPGLNDMTWAVYEGAADGFAWSETSAYNFVNQYLRTEFQDRFTYGGAAARVMCQSRPSMLLGRPSWRYGEPETNNEPSLAEGLDFSDQSLGSKENFASLSERLGEAETRLQSLAEKENVVSVAAAKPFGSLSDTLPPHAGGVVLPVYTGVRLIPNVVVKENVSERDPTFHLFLIEYFGNPNYPTVPQNIIDKYEYYVQAMEWFSDPTSAFRTNWQTFDAWREDHMDGADDILGTIDDLPDPCEPRGGPGGGGGSSGGPPILH